MDISFSEDPCADNFCNPDGSTCVNGTCQCKPGYSGEYCYSKYDLKLFERVHGGRMFLFRNLSARRDRGWNRSYFTVSRVQNSLGQKNKYIRYS